MVVVLGDSLGITILVGLEVGVTVTALNGAGVLPGVGGTGVVPGVGGAGIVFGVGGEGEVSGVGGTYIGGEGGVGSDGVG
jgi:hypothetical protein